MIISNRGTAQNTVGEDEQGSCGEYLQQTVWVMT